MNPGIFIMLLQSDEDRKFCKSKKHNLGNLSFFQENFNNPLEWNYKTKLLMTKAW